MGRRKKSGLDNLYKLFLAAPWWVGLVVVFIIFFVLRFLLPGMLARTFSDTSNPVAAGMNKSLSQMLVPLPVLVAPWVTGLAFIVWCASLTRKWRNRNLLEQTRGLDAIRDLHWQSFEALVGEYYRRQGYSVEERGGPTPDEGIDLVLSKAGRVLLVQCKHWKAFKVGVRPVRELLGVMTTKRASGGILVTSGRFTREAIDFAAGSSIELVDGDTLEGMILSVQKANPDGTAPPTPAARETSLFPSCPVCGGPMVLRTAKTGPYAGSRFYGCKSYPSCRGTRNSAI